MKAMSAEERRAETMRRNAEAEEAARRAHEELEQRERMIEEEEKRALQRKRGTMMDTHATMMTTTGVVRNGELKEERTNNNNSDGSTTNQQPQPQPQQPITTIVAYKSIETVSTTITGIPLRKPSTPDKRVTPTQPPIDTNSTNITNKPDLKQQPTPEVRPPTKPEQQSAVPAQPTQPSQPTRLQGKASKRGGRKDRTPATELPAVPRIAEEERRRLEEELLADEARKQAKQKKRENKAAAAKDKRRKGNKKPGSGKGPVVGPEPEKAEEEVAVVEGAKNVAVAPAEKDDAPEKVLPTPETPPITPAPAPTSVPTSGEEAFRLYSAYAKPCLSGVLRVKLDSLPWIDAFCCLDAKELLVFLRPTNLIRVSLRRVKQQPSLGDEGKLIVLQETKKVGSQFAGRTVMLFSAQGLASWFDQIWESWLLLMSAHDKERRELLKFLVGVGAVRLYKDLVGLGVRSVAELAALQPDNCKSLNVLPVEVKRLTKEAKRAVEAKK